MSFAARSAIASSASNYTTVYNGTLTCGVYNTGTPGENYRGYNSGFGIGSVSPTTLTTGYAIEAMEDYRDTSGGIYSAGLVLSGFGADPGQDYLYSVTVNGISKLTSAATYYGFILGSVYWAWESGSTAGLWGLPTSGTVSAVILK